MTFFRTRPGIFALGLTLVCFVALAPAWAATHGAAAGNGSSGSGKAEGILVAEVLLLLVVGRLLGEVMQRLRQPALMGQLLAGIVLGPSLFGWVWPQAQQFIFPHDAAQKGMIDGLSQIGILMLLLLTGMETDLRLVRKSGFAAVAIALSGIALPFACGFATGDLFHQDRGDGGARDAFHAPQSRPDHRRHRDHGGHGRLGHHRHHFWDCRHGRRPRGRCRSRRSGQNRRGNRIVPRLLLHHRPLAGVQRDPLGQR
jgi:hypothetical protein